jgi:hypothetical protein
LANAASLATAAVSGSAASSADVNSIRIPIDDSMDDPLQACECIKLTPVPTRWSKKPDNA